MQPLNRQDFIKAAMRCCLVVELPDGAQVRIREISGADRDSYERYCLDHQESFENVRAKLVQLSLVDEHDELMFAENEYHLIGQLSAVAVNAIFEQAKHLNGLDVDAEETARKK